MQKKVAHGNSDAIGPTAVKDDLELLQSELSIEPHFVGRKFLI